MYLESVMNCDKKLNWSYSPDTIYKPTRKENASRGAAESVGEGVSRGHIHPSYCAPPSLIGSI